MSLSAEKYRNLNDADQNAGSNYQSVTPTFKLHPSPSPEKGKNITKTQYAYNLRLSL